MAFRFRVKLGSVEVEYEGDQEFDKKKILGLVEDVVHIYESSGKKSGGGLAVAQEGTGGETNKRTSIQLTTGNIAKKLGLGKGKDLFLAACAYLDFVAHEESFNKDAIVSQARTATSLFKASSHAKNSGAYIEKLVDGNKLNEIAKDTYAISDETKAELKAKLGIS